MLDCRSSLTVHHHLLLAKPLKTHHPIKPRSRVRCCSAKRGKEIEAKDYYQLLGVSVDSTPKEIKEAYRRLQKIYHPDIAGEQGHEYTLKLNEAYHALMRQDLRRRYDISNRQKREGFESNFSGLGYSSWSGPVRPQALFVDENRCIGCRECVHHARNTFAMDESIGCARVRVQFGDFDRKLEVAMESCPTNCIHWVESEDLPLLEFLARPQPKEAHGVFGGGWERPRDVFAAAKSFNKQLKRQEERRAQAQTRSETVEEETPSQAQARYEASVKLKWERIFETFGWLREFFASEKN